MSKYKKPKVGFLDHVAGKQNEPTLDDLVKNVQESFDNVEKSEPIVEKKEEQKQTPIVEEKKPVAPPVDPTMGSYIKATRNDPTSAKGSFDEKITEGYVPPVPQEKKPQSDPSKMSAYQKAVHERSLKQKEKMQEAADLLGGDLEKPVTQADLKQIKASLASLGGGGIGYEEAVAVATEYAKKYALPLDSAADSNLKFFLEHYDSVADALRSATDYETPDFDSDFATKTTNDLPEPSVVIFGDSSIHNRYFTEARARASIQSIDSALIYDQVTGNLAFNENFEGRYTTENFDSDFALKTTDSLTEGSNNLYYTTARHDSDTLVQVDSDYVMARVDSGHFVNVTGDTMTGNLIMGSGTKIEVDDIENRQAGGGITFRHAGGSPAMKIGGIDAYGNNYVEIYNKPAKYNYNAYSQIGNTDMDLINVKWFNDQIATLEPLQTTDSLAEGSVNLYYTDSRARSAISSGDSYIQYDSTTGEITFDASVIPEGYTTEDFDSDFLAKTTDSLTEGLSNLYYTTARFDSDATEIVARIDSDDIEIQNLKNKIGSLDLNNAIVLEYDKILSFDSNTDSVPRGEYGVHFSGGTEYINVDKFYFNCFDRNDVFVPYDETDSNDIIILTDSDGGVARYEITATSDFGNHFRIDVTPVAARGAPADLINMKLFPQVDNVNLAPYSYVDAQDKVIQDQIDSDLPLKYVEVAGDTMTGNLNLDSGANIQLEYGNITVKGTDKYIRAIEGAKLQSNTLRSVGNSNISISRNGERRFLIGTNSLIADRKIKYNSGYNRDSYTSDLVGTDSYTLMPKWYVDEASTGQGFFVNVSGDSMTGALSAPKFTVGPDPENDSVSAYYFYKSDDSTAELKSANEEFDLSLWYPIEFDGHEDVTNNQDNLVANSDIFVLHQNYVGEFRDSGNFQQLVDGLIDYDVINDISELPDSFAPNNAWDILTSTDGINWTRRYSGADSAGAMYEIQGSRFDSDRFTRIGDRADKSARFDWSFDGITWYQSSQPNLFDGISTHYAAYAYGGGRYIVVMPSARVNGVYDEYSFYSDDGGDTWTKLGENVIFDASGGSNDLSMAYRSARGHLASDGNGTWVAVTDNTSKVSSNWNRKIKYSTDNGLTWNNATTTTDGMPYRSVAYHDGLWIAVGGGSGSSSWVTENGLSTYDASTSTDGITWTPTRITSDLGESGEVKTEWQHVVYVNDRWLAFSDKKDRDQPHNETILAAQSFDGVNWTKVKIPELKYYRNWVNDVAWNGEKLLLRSNANNWTRHTEFRSELLADLYWQGDKVIVRPDLDPVVQVLNDHEDRTTKLEEGKVNTTGDEMSGALNFKYNTKEILVSDPYGLDANNPQLIKFFLDERDFSNPYFAPGHPSHEVEIQMLLHGGHSGNRFAIKGASRKTSNYQSWGTFTYNGAAQTKNLPNGEFGTNAKHQPENVLTIFFGYQNAEGEDRPDFVNWTGNYVKLSLQSDPTQYVIFNYTGNGYTSGCWAKTVSVEEQELVQFQDGQVYTFEFLDITAAKDEIVSFGADATVRFSEPVDMQSNRITDVADPVDSGDAVNKQWVLDNGAGIDPNDYVSAAGDTMTGLLSIYQPYEAAQSLAIGKSGQTRIRVYNNGEMKWSSSASDARLNRVGGNFTISVDNNTYMKFDRAQGEIEVNKTLTLAAPDPVINLPNNSDVGELQSNGNRRFYWGQNNVGIDVPLTTNDNSITVGDGDVIVGSNGQIVTNKINSTSNFSLFFADEEKLRVSAVTTTSFHALAYGSGAMTQVEGGGTSFLVHKGYVDTTFATKTAVDKCVSKTSTSDQSMKANLISAKDITAKKLKAVTPSGTADTAIIVAEGYRTGTGGAAARVTLSNSYNANAYGTLELWGTSGTNVYFKFNKDIDLDTNGLHSVKRIRMTGSDKTISEGTTARIKLDSRVEILRPGNNANGFKIHGTDDTGTAYPSGLLSVYHNDATAHDAINYNGKMESSANIVNKGYVDSLIADLQAQIDALTP